MRRHAARALLLLAPIACTEAPERPATPPSDARATEVGAGEPGPGTVAEPPGEIEAGGHGVYVPVYSHIYHHRDDAFLLTATLSVRNTDLTDSLTLTAVRYYDTSGRLVRRFVEEPRTLGPLQSFEAIIEEQDTSGGSGANFIVEWRSDVAINPPVIEAVMISTRSGQGISFTSRGVPIQQLER